MITLLLTDEQLIDRVRRAQRYRRLIGTVCMVVGFLAIGVVVYWVNDMHARSLAILNSLARAANPTTQQVAQSLDESGFIIGFTVGVIAAGGFAGACVLSVTGLIHLLARNRKDLLLLKCWDASAPADLNAPQHNQGAREQDG